MTKYKVVLVSFPFDDLSATKVRPAVCLTEPIGSHRHVVLAFITSRVPVEPLTTDLILDASQPDFSLSGLRFVYDSVASTFDSHTIAHQTRVGYLVASDSDANQKTNQKTI